MVADADARKAEVAHLNKHAVNGGDPRMFKIPDDPRIDAGRASSCAATRSTSCRSSGTSSAAR